jgi:hypothetical protein
VRSSCRISPHVPSASSLQGFEKTGTFLACRERRGLYARLRPGPRTLISASGQITPLLPRIVRPLPPRQPASSSDSIHGQEVDAAQTNMPFSGFQLEPLGLKLTAGKLRAQALQHHNSSLSLAPFPFSPLHARNLTEVYVRLTGANCGGTLVCCMFVSLPGSFLRASALQRALLRPVKPPVNQETVLPEDAPQGRLRVSKLHILLFYSHVRLTSVKRRSSFQVTLLNEVYVRRPSKLRSSFINTLAHALSLSFGK